MAEIKIWTLKTPYGDLVCKKGRSYGEKIWRPVPSEKQYKGSYFDDKGNKLYRDIYVHVGNRWIPSYGNEEYAKRMNYADWKKAGEPKTIDGKKLGLVVKKIMKESKTVIEGKQDMVFKAMGELKINKVELRRYVSEDSKYIIPITKDIYNNIIDNLNRNQSILITQPVQIATNSANRYVYGIIPYGKYLMMIELLSEDLANPFPPDALIPKEENLEVGEIEEGEDDLI
jgi:hypothetical protein